MSIEKLQKELIEKISYFYHLIPAEAGGKNIGKEALEIINKLKKHINDDITVNNTDGQKFTTLDYVIIANSSGDNPRLSERPRINNTT